MVPRVFALALAALVAALALATPGATAAKKEVHQFETEVNRMMDIIIHSLYKSKEIFIRELVSNAADALDKIRFLSLTDARRLEANPALNITVVPDAEAGTLTVWDGGVGMSKADLIKNLGTIAKSGTSEFVAALAKNGSSDIDQIGQFGVGFYSVFLVADNVTVVSKNDEDDKQYIWQSDSRSGFTVAEDPRGATLGRGTQIILHLKPDAAEYLDPTRLRGLLTRYSQFVRFPIYLYETTTVTEEVPDEAAAEDSAAVDEPEEPADEDGASVEDVDASDSKAADAVPKTKSVSRNVTGFNLVNEQKPVWMRDPSSVSEEDYTAFYKAVFKDTADPLAHTHFKAEGGTGDFRALCFVPGTSPPDFFQNTGASDRNVRLFVKRVFITDELGDFLPKYLAFVKCIIDADDIELNVSRETLQQSALLQLIRRKLISKLLDLFASLARDEENREKYRTFWREYALQLKYGAMDDKKHGEKITELLRFETSAGGDPVSLRAYVDRMKNKQPQIYYLTGGSLKEIAASPFLERLFKRGYEVLYLAEPIDEYLVQSLTTYDGKPLQNIAKEGLKLGSTKAETERRKELEAEFAPLQTKLKEWLEKYVEKVVLSTRLVKSPCAVVAMSYGWTGQAERMMKAQALSKGGDYMHRFQDLIKRIFEINPYHPVVRALLAGVKRGDASEEEQLRNTALVLYEATALKSGYMLKDVNGFVQRVENVVRFNLDVPEDAAVDEPDADEGDDAEEFVDADVPPPVRPEDIQDVPAGEGPRIVRTRSGEDVFKHMESGEEPGAEEDEFAEGVPDEL